MKRNIKLFAGAIALGLIAFASCKKSSSSASLIGTWKASQDAIDVNMNHKLDANEKYTDTSGQSITFSNNGTGYVSIAGTEIGAFAWSQPSSNTIRTITTDTFGGTTTYDTSTVQIAAISSGSLTVLDTSGGVYSWTIFTK
jgi:hypothetical protein